MRDQRARQILHSLVNGADPFTGGDLAPGTVLQHADVMRAMLAGCSALDDRTAREIASAAVRDGLRGIGSGPGPVDVIGLADRGGR